MMWRRMLRPMLSGALVVWGTLAWTVSAGAGEPLATPKGTVILSIDGDVAVRNSASAAEFDLEMLRALPVSRIATSTPWTEGVVTFDGVALDDLLDRLEVASGTLQAIALNDYRIEIPVGDAAEVGPIIAYLRDGETMSVRRKGPLWIIYPFDRLPIEQAEVYRSRSIWQLRKLTVRAK